MNMFRYLTQASWLKWPISCGLTLLVIAFWPEWQERRELAKLRAEACEIMEALGFLQAEPGAACTKNDGVYLAGIDAAVKSQTTHFVGKVDRELAQLARANAQEDPETFEGITFTQYLDDYASPMELLAENSDRLSERIVMDVPWVMITEYGQVRVEDPASDPEGTAQKAALLSMDPKLRGVQKETVAIICRRSNNPNLHCGGTVYARRASNNMSGYQVVRLELNPIDEAQINAANQSLIRPQFTGSQSSTQGSYIQRFINAFGLDGPICRRSIC